MAGLSLHIIGAGGAGKSAVFDALVGTPDGIHCTEKNHLRIGAAKVIDPRLEALRDLFAPKKYSPAEISFVDHGGGGKKNVDELAAADAFVLVLQAYGDIDYNGKPVDPAGQMESVLLDCAVSDMEKIDKRLERIAKENRTGVKVPESEINLLQTCHDQLSNGKSIQSIDLNEEERKCLRGYQFLSLKPLVAVLNVAEDNCDGRGYEKLEAMIKDEPFEILPFCATLETEIAQLPPEEQQEFLNDYGLEAPARHRVIREAYSALNLVSFFTVGADEVKAWTVTRGATALKAAGRIHSDIERGFIRAETMYYQDLLDAGSISKCKENNTFRLEGKDYSVKDGDIFSFRFNV